MNRVFAGIDLSLNGTGIAIVKPDGTQLSSSLIKSQITELNQSTGRNKQKQLIGVERLSLVKEKISKILRSFGVTDVAIEGYAFGAMGRAIFSIGEMGGTVRTSIYEMGIKIHEVPPTTLKAFVTGSGAASKEEVIEHIKKKWGVTFADHNIADAYGLSMMLVEFGDNIDDFCKAGGAKRIRAYFDKKAKNPSYK